MMGSPVSALSGSVSLPSSSSSLLIPSLQVSLMIKEDPTLTSPIIDYSISLDVKEIYRVSENSITFDVFTPSPIADDDSSGTMVTANKFLVSTLLVAGGLVFSQSPILSFASFSAASMFAVSNAASYPLLELTLRVPPNYQFGTLSVKAPYATTISSSSALYTDSLTLNLCSEGTTSNTISLKGIYVFTKLETCAVGDITLEKVRTSSSLVNISVTSTAGSITTSFLSGYYGGYEAYSNKKTAQILGDCSTETVSSGKKGLCGKKSSTYSNFKAENDVYVNFGTGCSADWLGDPQAKDVVVDNDKILSYVPSYVVNVSDGNPSLWSYYMPTGQQNGYSYAGTKEDAGAAVVYQEAWANRDSHIWYTIVKRVLPKVYKGFSYDIEFEFRQDSANLDRATNSNGGYNITQFSIVIFENHESVWHAAESLWFYYVAANASYDPAYSLGYCNVTNADQLATSTYVKSSCTITTSRNSTNAVVAFRAVNQDTNLNNFRYYFRNVLVTTPNTPTYVPPLLTRDSELITLRKAPANLEANPRLDSDCPHKMSNLRFFHDPSLWPGNTLPSASSTITLPANTNVLISSCSLDANTIYSKIVIPATSSLIFDDAPIEFHVQNILVQGKFLIGSSKCRIFSNITITFHGQNNTQNTIGAGMGSKGMGVDRGGVVEIHGKQFHNSWSRIAASAAGGDDRVYLQDDVNWEVGQQIVVTATILNDLDYNQNEVVTIVAKQGRTIVFTPPLRYFHFGGQEYQAEVGVLDRRITIQGNFADSEADNSSFGGHIQIMGEGRFSGVRFLRMGQLNRLARYPVHFHMIGLGGKGSFVHDCSFYKCFFRCISIHGTYETELLRNVAFDIKGHCYYLEDGTEENNTISFNMAAYIKPVGRPAQGFAQAGEVLNETPDLTQPADSAASGFYITNAYNRIVGNAASGGWAGFSFPNLYIPIHLNAYRAPYDPSGRPTLEFDSNTARGSGNIFGNSGCIYVGGWLTHQQNDNNTGTTPLTYVNGRYERTTRYQTIPEPYGSPKANFTMTNIKTSLCSMGVAHWSDCQLVNYESHDNFRSAMLFGKSWMGNALVVGRTSNPLSGTPPLGLHQGFEFYDTYTHTILTNVTFRNFHLIPNLQSSDPHNDNKVFVSMTHSDLFKPEGMSVARNITFEDVEPNAILGVNEQDTGSSRMFNLYDTDGSIATHMGINSKGKPVIIGSYSSWWNFDSECKFITAWNAWVCPRQEDTQEILNIGLYVPTYIDYGVTGQSYDHIGKISLFGNGIPSSEVRSMPVTRNSGITGISHVGWLFELDNGSPSYIEINTIQIPRGSYLLLAVPYPSGTTFSIETKQWNNVNLPFYYTFGRVNSFEEVRNGNGTVYFFDNVHLYVKVIDFAIDNIEDFYRDNAVVHTYNNGFLYYIRASCPSYNTIGEVKFCQNTPTSRPSYNW